MAISLILPIAIFIFALILRYYFFSGFILGDDPQEFALCQHVLNHGAILEDQLHLRFGVWFFNVISFMLLGVSEFSFFLPTVLMSASIPVICYFLLTNWGYSKKNSFLSGLFVASAPFEIFIGGLRANDLIFTWLIALAFLSFFIFKKKPILQGESVAFFLWFAFYVKLWLVYLFPIILIYYLFKYLKKKEWKSGLSFFSASAILHSITAIIWKFHIDMFLPFLVEHPPSYPRPTEQLINLFQVYPGYILYGAEFGNTLFGFIPYLLIILLTLKLIISLYPKRFLSEFRFDKFDYYLLGFYGSFFLFLNFFPNTFVFDQYYSIFRIFRYLTPISFPMAIHLAKLLIDLGKAYFKDVKFKKYAILIIFVLIISVNIIQAEETTRPGRIYRNNILEVVDDIRKESPEAIVLDSWPSIFLEFAYLGDMDLEVNVLHLKYTPADYENWLREEQYNFKEGTMLITSLSSYVYYGCRSCGFVLHQFENELDPGWKVYKEYGTLSYLPIPEKVIVYVWEPELS